ncbi:MAG: ABC transporter ATP-binding protein [Armatimonadetes bacterium]|nr:ABC transporter ATP-binding protein [Armatimonadota bacterium]MBI2973514.1 ABC transporter ATP-binding protein [Armatimonadota bacterium]
MHPVLIELKGITKRFPGVVANDYIDLTVLRGEIHAIVGENGAGKSTLMRILYGLYQPDEGSIEVNGSPVVIDSPRKALQLGIGMVHQHFMLIPRFTVAENVILGSEPAGALGRLRRKEAEQRVRELCRQYGFALDPAAEVSMLSVGEQQRVEIIKVLYRGADVLILDEPTAVLVPQEVDELFANLRRLREQGKTIIFISHMLDEVLEISDRITVLRRGRVVGTVPAAGTTKSQLAEMMVGRPVLLELEHPPVTPGEVRLEAREVTVAGRGGRPVVSRLSLAVRAGEIYGIAGVEGNGQTELVEALVGLRPVTSGRILIEGHDVANASARAIRLLGAAHIPEDRHRRGLVLPMAVWENVVLGHHSRPQFLDGAFVDRKAIESFANERVEKFDIRLSNIDVPALALSGGNQQKVIVAREFSFNPKVLIAAQPTRGLDIGATEFVERQLLEARSNGMAVLLISANLEEVLSLSDRIGVMCSGELVAEFRRGEATPQELGLYMTGTRRAGATSP